MDSRATYEALLANRRHPSRTTHDPRNVCSFHAAGSSSYRFSKFDVGTKTDPIGFMRSQWISVHRLCSRNDYEVRLKAYASFPYCSTVPSLYSLMKPHLRFQTIHLPIFRKNPIVDQNTTRSARLYDVPALPQIRTTMHLSTTALLTGLLALTTHAVPFNTTNFHDPRAAPKHHHGNGHSGSHPPTFAIHLWNNCGFTKQFATYSVTPSFQMLQHSPTITLAHGKSHILRPHFHAIGMRLAGHAELGVNGQWIPQALFEFGYSSYAGRQGTAYDVSIMEGSDKDIGVGVWPMSNGHGSGGCKQFVCWPWNCPPSQGWTDPGQTSLGSPADTVCYEGKTDFKVVFCP